MTNDTAPDAPPSALASGRKPPHRVSYGATTQVPTDGGPPAVQIVIPTQVYEYEGEGVVESPTNGYSCDAVCDEAECLDMDMDDLVDEALLNISWVWLSRLYLLVPILTTLFFLSMVALVTWGWPPSRDERDEGQEYPHPFFWKAFLVGIFASMTVQALRVPMFVATSWLPLSSMWTVAVSTVLHAVGHEAVRLVSVPLTIPSPTSGFHSSFWLGLGWGLAETTWGIVQGWEQLSLYEDVLTAPQLEWTDGAELGLGTDTGLTTVPEESALLRADGCDLDEDALIEDEDELERRVLVLERMRARHGGWENAFIVLTAELEQVMGLPFPLIPLALHILWRIDTLILNLGLTLILSAFWFDPEPIYKHQPSHGGPDAPPLDAAAAEWPPYAPNPHPSRYLPLAWVLVAFLHAVLALVWKVVGRVGVGAVTWGGLIVALGSVFAGLGAWGGLV